MSDPRRVHVLINPISGRGGGLRMANQLRHRLKAMGWPVEIEHTRAAGDAGRVTQGLDPQLCKALVIVGGDGTVREAATCGSDVPLALLPTGTENLIARQLRIGSGVDGVIGLLKFGRVVELDIAVLKCGDGVMLPFVAVAGIGFDAEVVRRVAVARRGHIDYATYFWPTWRTFWSFDHPVLRVETEDGEVFQGTGLAFVGCISRYALGLRILKRAAQRDGRLDVCVFECRRRLSLLPHAIRTVFQRHKTSAHVYYRQAKWVRITSPARVNVQLDGDIADPLPAEITISSKRALFLAPPDWRE